MRGWLLILCAACGGGGATTPDAGPLVPAANPEREVIDTALAFDVTALTATATIVLGPSAMPGATLEVGDLMVDSVTSDGADVAFARTGAQLDLALAARGEPTTIEVAYRWVTHEGFEGASKDGYTLLWPYHCGNLFPCHSEPRDGTTFSLDVTGVPAGQTAVFPRTVAEAPAYQIAWSIDEYTEIVLGTTTAGTKLSIWHRPGEEQFAMNGTQNLLAAFDWLEKTLGPYRFGDHAGTISVEWPRGALGGMEHHPFWHIASGALASQETNVHEAVHGWFGGGIRIGCWEDFVLSEGTTTYLAARALDVVAPAVGAQTWQSYETELSAIPGTDPVWPQSCGMIDVIEDNLFTNAPYVRGAFFYKALADKLGAAMVDQVLAAFYQAHAGKSATMADMLQTIQTVTGYDAAACAETWLRATVRPTPGPCP